MKFSKVRNERRKIYNLLRSASSLVGLSAWSLRPSAPVFVKGCVLLVKLKRCFISGEVEVKMQLNCLNLKLDTRK